MIALTGEAVPRLCRPPARPATRPCCSVRVDRDIGRARRPGLAVRVDRMLGRRAGRGSGPLPHGLPEGRTASRALGYRQVLGTRWPPTPSTLTPTRNREGTVRPLAVQKRRQRSWFRRTSASTGLDGADLTSAAHALSLLARTLAV
ncbi:hypothetical protein HBB16_03255 [Pseudonocardia sp. MCCB 268]|nr:hypothetical protein [Pseudonocardia cytotoxica]